QRFAHEVMVALQINDRFVGHDAGMLATGCRVLDVGCSMLINEPRFLRASNRFGRRDGNDNARRRIRRGAARTTARFVRDRFAAGPVGSARRPERIQTDLRRAAVAASSVSYSLRTKTSASAPGLRNHVR